jgi:hypothetical protein
MREKVLEPDFYKKLNIQNPEVMMKLGRRNNIRYESKNHIFDGNSLKLVEIWDVIKPSNAEKGCEKTFKIK